jgi:hypothetical protein
MEDEGRRVKDVGRRMGGKDDQGHGKRLKDGGWSMMANLIFQSYFSVSDKSVYLICLPSQGHPKGVVDAWVGLSKQGNQGIHSPVWEMF